MKNILEDLISSISPEKLASMIDHTVLKPVADIKMLEKYIEDYRRYRFASLVVPPSLISLVREIGGRNIRIATVIGFPLGYTFTDAKVLETRRATEDGAKEVDMVINVNWLKMKRYDLVLEDIRRVVEEARKNGAEIVKVIIEAGLLTDEEKIKATKLVLQAGADYVKTSTGFTAGGATVHDVRLLYEAGEGRLKVKAAGGIRHALDALAMIAAGASRIGTSTGDKIMEEYIRLKGD